jgi:hypothetical protein
MGWRSLLALAMGAGLALPGCQDEEAAPPGGGPGGGTGFPIASDAGTDAAADAGADGSTGPSDAGLPPGCVPVEDPASGANRATITATTMESPPSFEPTRAYARWNPAECDLPPQDRRVLVGLTEGECRPGLGKRLVFQLQADQIGTGLAPGSVDVSFNQFLNVVFTVPATSALWSNTSDSSGSVNFEELGDTAGDPLRGTFNMQLVPSAGGADGRINVRGAFDVTLRRDFEEVCTPASDM